VPEARAEARPSRLTRPSVSQQPLQAALADPSIIRTSQSDYPIVLCQFSTMSRGNLFESQDDPHAREFPLG
jgi:hypothetical protein